MRHTSALALALVAAGPTLERVANDNRAPFGVHQSMEVNEPAGNNPSGGDVVDIEDNQDGLPPFASARDSYPSRVLASA